LNGLMFKVKGDDFEEVEKRDGMMHTERRRRRGFTGMALTAAIAMALVLLPLARPNRAAAAGGSVTFSGHGKGHGVGMCMSGAYFRSLAGEDYHSIISYYYQGVDFGAIDDNRPIRVLCRDGVVRTFSMREYLYRQGEEPDSWPQGGLRVLAVAMRTYTMSVINRGKHAADGYDICSSGACCQAFDETVNPSSRPNTVAAVNATAGEIITYQGQPIVAAYSGCCGGYTAGADEVWGGTGYPYWKPVPDPYCAGAKGHDWNVTVSWGELEASLNSNGSTAVGSLYGFSITGTGASGRVTRVRIQGSAGYKDVSGSAFAEVVGLPTNFFSVTQQNFDEYILLQNPDESTQANVRITYMMPGGNKFSVDYVVSSNSRSTVYVNSFLQNAEVSAMVESDIPVLAERAMYFDYQGKWTGGHDVTGANQLSNTWYFAEGYTGPGFDEWVCVQNPGDKPANLKFHFQTQEEGLKEIEGFSVPAFSRQTFKVNDLLGGKPYQTSLALESDQPVVAERPIYFDYTGMENRHWTGGHCVVGVPSLSKQYYFAEGTTRPGFDEWLTLQNPNPAGIIVKAIYQLGSGQGSPVEKSYVVPANGRVTVFVPDEVGMDKDVAVFLSSASDFLAERPMYFDYTYSGASWTGGHCIIGSPQAANEWFFAEGYTGEGSNQWLCLQNPGDQDAVVEILYYTQEVGPLPARTETVPARSRKTIMVNDNAGPNYQLSTRIKVTSGPGIVAERPMYFNYNRTRDGGSDTMGIITPSTTWYFAEGYTGQ
jgi:SpoIID/LytB domain protein